MIPLSTQAPVFFSRFSFMDAPVCLDTIVAEVYAAHDKNHLPRHPPLSMGHQESEGIPPEIYLF